MKLVIAIVNDDDSVELLDDLTEAKFRVTKLATSGGFLRSGNTTLLIGVEEEDVKRVLEVIDRSARRRKQIVTQPAPMVSPTGAYVPYPLEVEVGGATIFVLDVDQFHRF